MVKTIREAARDISVFRECEVLVVGGGPAGSAAAAAAAQLGADTILVERYGYLGGMATGGFVLFIDRMSDWSGRQVITGFADELLERMPKDAILGPPKELLGSKDPQVVQYWEERYAAHQGIVTWSPSIDPEWLKIVSNDLLLQKGVKLLLHCWAVAPIQDGSRIGGIIFESKAGRKAILAKAVVDATGDGDIFAPAGAPFEADIEEGTIHCTMNVAFRWGGVDFQCYNQFHRERKDEFDAIWARAHEFGVRDRPNMAPREGTAYFMAPKLPGYSCTDVEDLTTVELESRRLMLEMLDFYRNNMPGFENAWIMDTAPQMGVRHSRRLVGVKSVTRSDWVSGRVHEDEIGICPPPSPQYPNVSVPLGCLIPVTLENLIAAGRNLSCDPPTHNFLREIPVCWLMGQAAGTTAAVAVRSGARIRDIDVRQVQRELLKQGVCLHEQVAAQEAPPAV